MDSRSLNLFRFLKLVLDIGLNTPIADVRRLSQEVKSMPVVPADIVKSAEMGQ